jgi:hypothetical protein
MYLVKIMVEVYMSQKDMYKIFVFGSVVNVVVFQSAFYLEMHQNIFFIFFNYFLYQSIKII